MKAADTDGDGKVNYNELCVQVFHKSLEQIFTCWTKIKGPTNTMVHLLHLVPTKGVDFYKE